MAQPKMLLIDVSNSWTKFALARGSRLQFLARRPTPEITPRFLSGLNRRHKPDLVVAASVVPSIRKILGRVWSKSRLVLLDHRTKLPIRLRYPNPASIGADRIANAVATARLYPLPAVVIDFGTAVTFDIVSAKREYLGGVIAPGLNAMTDYLHEKTALLPKITIREPRHAIGKSTIEAMRVGAVTGYRGLIQAVLDAIQKQMRARHLTVVATGGHSALIARHAPFIQIVNPLLTLQGLQFIAENYSNKSPLPESKSSIRHRAKKAL
ncbi:MAG: type III pantothenate kinase [Methylacidiphilales bacterium]|nr:type III pantothenate kinase [Candidatus Methylacidiphilales bacterium]